MKKAAVPSILIAVVLLAVGVIAEAQQPKKVPLIGYSRFFLHQWCGPQPGHSAGSA